MDWQSSEFIFKFFLFYMPLLFSLCVHEFAHAWTAKKFGDLTASNLGRLSLNPLVHIDYIGSVLLPLIFLWTGSPIFFGWAKPVPVNPANFENPKKDMFWTAFAGPLSNLLLALVATGILTAFFLLDGLNSLPSRSSLLSLMEMAIFMNLLLAFFNLIPLHPLDGGKVMARFLPAHWNMFLERNQTYSTIALVALIFVGGFTFLAQPVIFLSQSLIFLSHWTGLALFKLF